MTETPEFEWDDKKNEENIKNREIDFDDAIGIWEGPVLDEPDERFAYDEDRYIAYGETKGRVLAVSYAIREDRYRIITARKAEKHEQRKYYRATVPQGPPTR